jgi:rRNA-processing protein FCF1
MSIESQVEQKSQQSLENLLLDKLRPLIQQLIKEELEALSKEDKPKSILSLVEGEKTKLSKTVEEKLLEAAEFIITHRKELGF